MSADKISVIIPSYNSSRTIENCLRSVINTAYPDLEIIVVDDCSSDDSPEKVAGLVKEYPSIIRLMRQASNGGPAKARNTGARNATGSYLFFLDSDTEMLPDALVNFHNRIREADAVTGIYHYQPLNPGPVSHYKALLNYYFFSRKGVIAYEVFDASRAGIKREVFASLGGFNEDLKWGMDYENEEFGYRLCQRYRNLLDPEVAVKHWFPDLQGLTRTYFLRVALWMEIFVQRRKFESGGVTTAGTGFASLALLLAFLSLPAILLNGSLIYLSLAFFLAYFYGYCGFWGFLLQRKPWFFPMAVLLNMYFTLVIAAGALYGLIMAMTPGSEAGKIGL